MDKIPCCLVLATTHPQSSFRWSAITREIRGHLQTTSMYIYIYIYIPITRSIDISIVVVRI